MGETAIDWEAAAAYAERQVLAALAIPTAQLALMEHDIELTDLGGLFLAKCVACPDRQVGPRLHVLMWGLEHKRRSSLPPSSVDEGNPDR